MKWKAKRNKKDWKWHTWFCVLPVYINGHWVVLRHVERKHVDGSALGQQVSHWQYRWPV